MEKKDMKTMVMMDATMKKNLKTVAERRGTQVSSVIRLAIIEHLRSENIEYRENTGDTARTEEI